MAVSAAGLALQPSAAQAATTGSWYYLQGSVQGAVTSYAHFGSASDTVLTGDWDGDGRDTLAVRRGNVYYVTNAAAGGATAYSFTFGSRTDEVLVGDWNGDGVDTLGVRRGSMYYLSDNRRGGFANRVFRYGSAGDAVVVGDWNGDRKDTLGVRRGYTYYLTNAQGGAAQVIAKFGSATDVALVGDWNGDRKDTLGVRRGHMYYLTNATTGRSTSVTEGFGNASDSHIVGDWNGDRVDTVGVRRAEGPARTLPGSGAFAVGSQVHPGLYKGSAPADACYWERVSDFSGSSSSVIANYFGAGMAPIYVEVKASDAGFGTDGCGTWTEARDSDPTHYRAVRDGQFRVGTDMGAGRYQAPGGADCYWERVSDFSGDLDAIAANGLGETNPIVDVQPTDVGFDTDACGTWTRVSAAQQVSRSVTRRTAVQPPWAVGAREHSRLVPLWGDAVAR